VEAGLNFGNASTPAQISSSTKTGFIAGINLEFNLDSMVSILPELLYVQRSSDFIDSGVSVTAKYDAVEIPILLKLKFGDDIKPYVFGGPAFIYNISRSVVANSGTTTATFSFQPKTFDLALDAGVGVEFLQMLFVNLRYSLGILNINEGAGSWNSRGIQLLAGVKF
jgi:Outer membrane protein beta-barrel domain